MAALRAAELAGTVRRVVLTSSAYAVGGEPRASPAAREIPFTERDWNTTSSAEYQAYAFSKTLAEQRAWGYMEQHRGCGFDLVAVLPGLLLGPPLSQAAAGSESVRWVRDFIRGKFWLMGWGEVFEPVCDVRDAAAAHVAAAITPGAKGRYLVAGPTHEWLEIANGIRRADPTSLPPRYRQLKSLLWLAAPALGYERRYIETTVGRYRRFDSERAMRELGIQARPFEDTVRDMVVALKALGIVPPQASALRAALARL